MTPVYTFARGRLTAAAAASWLGYFDDPGGHAETPAAWAAAAAGWKRTFRKVEKLAMREAVLGAEPHAAIWRHLDGSHVASVALLDADTSESEAHFHVWLPDLAALDGFRLAMRGIVAAGDGAALSGRAVLGLDRIPDADEGTLDLAAEKLGTRVKAAVLLAAERLLGCEVDPAGMPVASHMLARDAAA